MTKTTKPTDKVEVRYVGNPRCCDHTGEVRRAEGDGFRTFPGGTCLAPGDLLVLTEADLAGPQSALFERVDKPAPKKNKTAPAEEK